MTSRLRLFVTAAVLSICSIAHAEVELKNDGFVSGGAASFQTGFVGGEAGGVRFVAASAGRQLTKLQLLFGGATTTKSLTLKVYDDTAGSDEPGMELFTGDFELTGSDTAMQELDVTSGNIIVPAQFRVAIIFQHNGAPTLATDADTTITADRNFIMAAGFGWKKSSELGLAGDWVIRAFVTDMGGPDLPVFCDSNTDCPGGQFCDVPHHACITGCRTDSDCSSGTCNSQNQCTGDGGGDDGGCRTDGSNGGGGGLAFTFGTLALLVVTRRFCKAAR